MFNDWINDEMPEHLEEVILGDCISEIVSFGYYDEVKDCFFCLGLKKFPSDFDVTHWMPKPEISPDLQDDDS